MATFMITVAGKYFLGLFYQASNFMRHLLTTDLPDVDVNGKPILSSPLSVNIIPAGATVSYAIIRGAVQAGDVYKFQIMTADLYGNLLSSSTYKRYGTKDYNVQIQYIGESKFNSSLGNVMDKKGKELYFAIF
jgi:hypothetical protein